MTSAATDTRYVYGVQHVDWGNPTNIKPHPNRERAEADLAGCRIDHAECYLVRMPQPGWERVPDGE